MLSSPIVNAKRKAVSKSRMQQPLDDFDDEEGYNSFVVPDDEEEDSDEDAFEPRRPVTSRSRSHRADVGPPITSDKLMQQLPEPHAAVVEQFVDEARKFEEKLRTRNGHRSSYFRETDFREMAIRWTLSLKDMASIDGIDRDKVKMYGAKFLPLVEKCYHNYEEMMGFNDRDMDDNHHNVINLVDDDEDLDDVLEDEDVEDELEEQQSRYFDRNVSNRVQEFNNQMAAAAPKSRPRTAASPAPSPQRKGKANAGSKQGFRGKDGKWHYKKAPRKSNDSNSTSRSRVSKSAGTSKKAAAPRKNSAASSKSSATTRPNIMEAFGRTSGGSGGGGGFAAMDY